MPAGDIGFGWRMEKIHSWKLTRPPETVILIPTSRACGAGQFAGLPPALQGCWRDSPPPRPPPPASAPRQAWVPLPFRLAPAVPTVGLETGSAVPGPGACLSPVRAQSPPSQLCLALGAGMEKAQIFLITREQPSKGGLRAMEFLPTPPPFPPNCELLSPAL